MAYTTTYMESLLELKRRDLVRKLNSTYVRPARLQQELDGNPDDLSLGLELPTDIQSDGVANERSDLDRSYRNSFKFVAEGDDGAGDDVGVNIAQSGPSPPLARAPRMGDPSALDEQPQQPDEDISMDEDSATDQGARRKEGQSDARNKVQIIGDNNWVIHDSVAQFSGGVPQAASGIRTQLFSAINTNLLCKDHFGGWEEQIAALLDLKNARYSVGDRNLFYTTGSKISGKAGNHVYVGLRDQRDYVAVKRCLTENVGKEILVAKSLEGKKLKHVLTFTDIIKDGLFTYYVSDLCLTNLKSLIEEGSRAPLSLRRRLSICQQILQGQMELHKNGIVHRDLKPSNILFDHDGEVLIAGFDVSLLLTDETSTVTDGVGSQCWMPMEILEASAGPVRYRRSSDIEVSGRLLYYVLTEGHHPYEEMFPYTNHPVQITQNILQNRYSLKHLHDCHHLRGLLSAMMDQDPARRPTISECLQYLEKNAALDYEGKKKRSSRGELTSLSTSALEHQKMGSSSMEGFDDDEDDRTKCLRLSNKSKREHNSSSAPKKAKSKDGLKKASGGSGKQRASSSNTVRTRLKKDLEQKIFISFSFKDEEKALEIKERIEEHFGTCTWICTTDIKPGDILDAKTAEGIHNAKVMLCLMSQNFLDSTECEMEVQVARQLKKKFIEVQLEKIRMPRTKSDGTVSSVRMALTPRLYIPLYKDVEGSREHFEKLITGLQGMLA